MAAISSREDQRLSTEGPEGKIVSKYCNISKTQEEGGGGINPPPPHTHLPCTTVGV